jgi:alkylation response protein AidB-like acyl-CoA dehydrogenase
MAFVMYPGLSHGAYSAIHEHGTDEQRATYLPKMVEGAWTGTMNLTEPHCGTDLGLMRTKADPQADGTYKITGTKIFISAGEHDLSENIIHLVLAKIAGPDTPAGIKGVSLFIVPKFLINADGTLGARNAVTCGAIEHKMGIHSNATCVLNHDGAVGYLIGEAHKGMRAMFTMMNEARIGVATQGLSQSVAAYQNAVAYAHERLQGRALTGAKAPDKPADPIIVHPDIRRALMNIRAFNEGARALLLWTALHGDLSHHSPDEKARELGEDMMGLLTPVLKAYLTDKGFNNAVEAQQVFGGHGYIVANGAEQFVRDARIAQIYEGANGVQALDLVGRKLAANGGRAVFAWFGIIDSFIADHAGNAAIADFLDALKDARGKLEDGTTWLMSNALSNFDNAGAASMDYLYLFGLTGLAFSWAQMAAAEAPKASDSADGAFYRDKLITGRYFIARMLPDTGAHLAKLKTGAAPVMALAAESF